MAEDFDGTFDYSGGVNQAVRPDQIGDNQLSGAVNITLVNGPRPRDKFIQQDIKVVTEGGRTGKNNTFKTYDEIFRTGKIQFAADYYSEEGFFTLVLVSGILFRVSIDANIVEVISFYDFDTKTSIELDEYRIRYNWSQGGRFFVIYDDPSYPVIVEGTQVRRANPNATVLFNNSPVPAPEIPIANIGVYNQFRLAVGLGINEFVIGDPAARGFPNGPISFSEVLNPSSSRTGQFFSVGNRPYNEAITYMGNLQTVDTGTGIGPLIVSTASQIWAYRTDIPASQWETTQGFGTILVANNGIAGPRAAINVGFDLIYMSAEGDIRSLNTSRQQQGTWMNTSISEEIKEYTKNIDPVLLKYTVLAYHNNRIFVTVNPYRVPTKDSSNNNTFDVAFKGMVSLATAAKAGLQGVTPPIWEGLWTGVNPTEFLQTPNSLYVLSKDGETNNLYKIEEADFDRTKDGFKRVRSRIYTKSYGMKSILQDKSLINLSASLSSMDIKNTFVATTYFKADQVPQYTKLQKITYSTDDAIVCCPNTLPSGLNELNLGGASNLNTLCDEGTNKNYAIWKKGQVMLELLGNWILSALYMRYSILNSSGTPEFQCDKKAKKLNKRNCDFASDWTFYSTNGKTLNDEDIQCRPNLPR